MKTLTTTLSIFALLLSTVSFAGTTVIKNEIKIELKKVNNEIQPTKRPATPEV